MDWNLTTAIIGAVIFYAGYRLGYRRGHAVSGFDQTWRPDPNISDEDIKTELRAGRKIEAIKLYRQRSGVGLKEAKDSVEAIDAGMGNARTMR